jgi:O-antigen/teichoic acid export membrane protein
MNLAVGSARTLIARGIFWNIASQVFGTVLAFVSMLILVRIMPPVEYGRWGALLGILVFINAFNCAMFTTQALQLPDGVEPDWSLHFAAGMRFQGALFLIANTLGLACRLRHEYRPIAPLLHLASIGLLIDAPSQLCQAMLRREMNFRRYRILHAVSGVLAAAITVGWGVCGGGAAAMVLGGNVFGGLTFGIDLLVVRRWRPRAGWWRRPDWVAYRPALKFGVQQALSTLVRSARGAVASAWLPVWLGLGAMGLINRAQGLVGTTAGRVMPVVIDSVYPLLPRLAADERRYGHYARQFVQALAWILWPAAIFIGLEGSHLSRLVYGQKWIAADVLLWPAAIAFVGVVASIAAGTILLAANRLRAVLILDVIQAGLTIPSVLAAHAGMTAYLWVLAGAELTAGAVALVAVSSLLPRGALWETLLPPAASTLAAAVTTLAVCRHLPAVPNAVHLAVASGVYLASTVLTLRLLFARRLATVLQNLPGGTRVGSWLRLPQPESLG